MLSTLKRQLKGLVSQGRHDEVFRRLWEETLDHDADICNDGVLLKSQYQEIRHSSELGLIAFQEKSLRLNNLNRALISLIDRIEAGDLNRNLRRKSAEHRVVPLNRALTCDRTEQTELVELNYFDDPGPEKKIRFFYVYGDDRQVHKSLFKRLGLDLGNFLLNWEKEDYDPGVKVKFARCKPRAARNLKIFEIDILRKLFAKFFEPVNAQGEIMTKKLVDLLTSPQLKDYGPDDFVFLLLTIDDYNWNESVTPRVVRRLIDGFCNCELPADSPAVFFFFGVEYQKQNEKVKNQVKKVIQEAEKGQKLPELQPVSITDVCAWLKDHDVLLPPGKSVADWAAELFPGQDRIDMIDVELKLGEVIERHNWERV